MSGIICVHIGSCGNSLGETFYDVISHEHGLTPTGQYIGNSLVQLQRLGVYYTLARRIYAKAILVDTDSATFQRGPCCSPYAEMFTPDNKIAGKGDGTGNNFAKGYNSEGMELLQPTLDAIRSEAERSDTIEGIQLCHSIGGGTGSGFTSLLSGYLLDEYPSKVIATYTVMPSSKAPYGVVEPYNAMLSLRHLIPNTNLSFMIDNEAMAYISTNVLHSNTINLRDMNYIVGHTMSGITSCVRFPGQLNTSLRSIQTNMCPYPNLHFLAPGFSPLIARPIIPYTKVSVEELVKQIFNTKNFLCSIDFKEGKLLTLAAVFRGTFSPCQIYETMSKAKEKSNNLFASWISNNIKWGICDIAPMLIPKSVSFIGNATGNTTLERIEESAMAMLKRKAYLHWYTGEGMEESEFSDAHDHLLDLIKDYQELANEET